MRNLKQQRQGLINRIQDAGGRAAAPRLNQRLQQKEAQIRQERRAAPAAPPRQAPPPQQGFQPLPSNPMAEEQLQNAFHYPESMTPQQFDPNRPMPQRPIQRPTPGGTNYQTPPPGFGVNLPPPGGPAQGGFQPMQSFQDMALDRAVAKRMGSQQSMYQGHDMQGQMDQRNAMNAARGQQPPPQWDRNQRFLQQQQQRAAQPMQQQGGEYAAQYQQMRKPY